MGEVPESLPVTEETRERLRRRRTSSAQATVLRLIDLLARRGRGHAPGRRPAPAARARARQGDPARAPTSARGAARYGSSSSRHASAARAAGPAPRSRRAPAARPPRPLPRPRSRPSPSRSPPSSLPRSSSSSSGAVGTGRAPARSSAARSPSPRCSREARPVGLEGRPPDARVPAAPQASTATSPRSRRTRPSSREALYQVTGRHLTSTSQSARRRLTPTTSPTDAPTSEEDFVVALQGHVRRPRGREETGP